MSQPSSDSPFSWESPSTGIAPPSPVVVNTVPVYFGGIPTPPSTPPSTVRILDDHAPCPPTPHSVPTCSDKDDLVWPDELDTEYWSTAKLDGSTILADQPASSSFDDRDRYDATLRVSDCLIYDREHYAYPSPVLTIIKRAELDLQGRTTESVDPHACGKPFELFSLTVGNTSATGLTTYDEQSFDYYVTHSFAPPLSEPERVFLMCFTVGTIQTLQHELRVRWRCVYPEPIPPVIIRLHDLIGPYALNARNDGYAYVLPSKNSIWDIIPQRGVDSEYRPCNHSAEVETDICRMGTALYQPQHVVASQLAVNVFLEIPGTEELAPTPYCQYLGAYVLQLGGLTLSRDVWAKVELEVKQSVFDRFPHLFKQSKRLWRRQPHLPCVRFRYYKWDQSFLGLANEYRDRHILATNSGIFRFGDTKNVCPDGSERHRDSSFDASSDGPVHSPEPEYMSFFDFSS